MRSSSIWTLIAFVLVLMTGGYARSQETPLGGRWVGELPFEGGDLQVYIDFASANDSVRGTVLVFEADLTIHVAATIAHDSISFVIFVPELGELSVIGAIEGGRIVGTVTHLGNQSVFYLRRMFDVSSASVDGQVGFYRDSDGGPLCVMYRALGGLTFYDFEKLAVGSRYAIGANEYARFDDHGRVSTRWTFTVDETGNSTGIEITNSDGSTESWPRIADAPFIQQNLTYANGEIALSGVLLRPSGVDSPPAIVYVHGSGANNTRNNYYDLFICQYLARNGIATLLPDKRGSGESYGDWRTAHITDFAADAVAGAQYLKTLRNIDHEYVGVIGFSQGGWVTPVVASTPNTVAFAVDISGSALPLAKTVTFEVEQLAIEAGLGDDDRARIMKLQTDAIAFVSGETTWEAFYRELQDATASDWAGREIAEGFPQTEDHWKWGFHRRNRDFDPIDYWQKVVVPSLIIYGQKDTQVPVGESLIRLDQEITGPPANLIEVEVYRNSGHAIGDQKSGWISGEFLAALAGWITKQAE